MKATTLRKLSFALVAALGLANTGCIKRALLKGQMEGTIQGSAAASTISDFEVAKAASFASLARFEGMHYLGPDLEPGLFLLTKGWAGAGFAFIEDDMEQAQDLHGEDSELVNYHKARAAAAYARATHYGVKLMEMHHEGFEAAQKNADTMNAWLAHFDDAEAHVPVLFWTGQAWLARTNMLKDEPDVVAELFVGVAMIKRAVELDENYNYASGHVILGAYHARSAMAELDDSKKHFDRAIQLTQGKALLAKYNLAVKYYCTKVDKENYVKLLTEVIEAGDVLPEQRLQNTIAKRRARRYLGKARMEACGFD
jgi:hypothetical protein